MLVNCAKNTVRQCIKMCHACTRTCSEGYLQHNHMAELGFAMLSNKGRARLFRLTFLDLLFSFIQIGIQDSNWFGLIGVLEKSLEGNVWKEWE